MKNKSTLKWLALLLAILMVLPMTLAACQEVAGTDTPVTTDSDTTSSNSADDDTSSDGATVTSEAYTTTEGETITDEPTSEETSEVTTDAPGPTTLNPDYSEWTTGFSVRASQTGNGYDVYKWGVSQYPGYAISYYYGENEDFATDYEAVAELILQQTKYAAALVKDIDAKGKKVSIYFRSVEYRIEIQRTEYSVVKGNSLTVKYKTNIATPVYVVLTKSATPMSSYNLAHGNNNASQTDKASTDYYANSKEFYFIGVASGIDGCLLSSVYLQKLNCDAGQWYAHFFTLDPGRTSGTNFIGYEFPFFTVNSATGDWQRSTSTNPTTTEVSIVPVEVADNPDFKPAFNVYVFDAMGNLTVKQRDYIIDLFYQVYPIMYNSFAMNEQRGDNPFAKTIFVRISPKLNNPYGGKAILADHKTNIGDALAWTFGGANTFYWTAANAVNTSDANCLTHETAHIVQQGWDGSAPAFFTEAFAEYMRYVYGWHDDPNVNDSWGHDPDENGLTLNANKSSIINVGDGGNAAYSGGEFLVWLNINYWNGEYGDIAFALYRIAKAKTFIHDYQATNDKVSTWVTLTGKTLETLFAEYKAAKIKLPSGANYKKVGVGGFADFVKNIRIDAKYELSIYDDPIAKTGVAKPKANDPSTWRYVGKPAGWQPEN